jgi:hypothetical protein
LGDNGWVSLLVEFGWLEPLPGTPRMPFTADNADGQPAAQIGLVALRDAVSRYQNGSVLVVGADSDEVRLVPLRRALQEHPDGSVLVFGGNAPTER